MVSLHHTDIDGVPCFWVESGRPTLAAQLIFRTGMADEWLNGSGWTHILEHLALHGRGGGTLAVNGSVSLLHTTFDAHGPARDVARHLTELAVWLSRPVFHEFEREKGVLQAESALRADSPSRRALGWRYGSLGPGTVSYSEPGISRATPAGLAHHAAGVFASGNAALVLDGPPPADLSLALPPGPLRVAPRAVGCGDVLPAACVDDAGLVLSGVVARSTAATFLPELLQRGLQDRLRDDAGAAYAPWATYEKVDEDQALVVAGSDLLAPLLSTIAEASLGLVRDLSTLGPEPSRLAEVREARMQAMRDPFAMVALAVRAAHDHLAGRRPLCFEEYLHETASVSAKDVQGEARAFRESLLLGLPSGSAWSGQLPMIGWPAQRPTLAGKRFRHRDWPAVRSRLVIAAQGVEMADRSQARRVEFENATGAVAHPDGARTLVSHDGWNLVIDPHAWHDGVAAVSLLDRLSPEPLRMAQPWPTPSTFRRRSWWDRWTTWSRTTFRPQAGSRGWTRLLPLALLILGVFTVIAAGLPGAVLSWALSFRVLAGLIAVAVVISLRR
jgi:hypothetical protein